MTPRPGGWDGFVPNPLDQLFLDYREFILRRVRYLIKDPDHAEDICSEIWLKIVFVYGRSQDFRFIENKRRFLSRVAERFCITYYRRQACRKRKANFVALDQYDLPSEPRRISQDAVGNINLLEALPPHLNPVQNFVLSSIVDKKSYRTIACEICDAGLLATCSKSTVGKIVKEIRRKAKSILGPMEL